MGIATTASAGPTCRNGMCTDGGGGGHAQSCTDSFGRTITWEFTDFEGGYERCSWGPPPRFSDKPDGSFALLGGCESIACGGLKKAPSLLSGAVASPSASAGNAPAVNPRAVLLQRMIAARLGSPAPSAAASRPVTPPTTRATPSFAAAPAARAATPVVPAYAAPAARAGVMIPPPSSYYAQWAKPKITSCESATTSNECREAAAAVQGNSMGSPRNTCEWSDGFGCRRVQLPL